MLGMAQQLFLKQKGEDNGSLPDRWPLLKQMRESNHLSPIDFALVEYILRDVPNASEPLAAFLCYLCNASRRGNLCVRVNQEEIIPDPLMLLSEGYEENGEIPSQNVLSRWRLLILEGRFHLLSEFPIHQEGDCYYLLKSWKQETHLINAFLKFFNQSASISIDKHLWKQKVQDLLTSEKLMPEQAAAILCAAENHFTIISGGPGTGKTYTAGYFLKILWECLPQEERSSLQIALAAPTGKAAANLEASICRALSETANFPSLTAQTLHGLLGIHQFKGQRFRRSLSANVIIVDESSMIDVQMMTTLLEAARSGARIIMLGDAHQLPSIESGSIFLDLVNYLRSSEKTKQHVAELQVCLRAELQGIIELANTINKGEKEKILRILHTGGETGVLFSSFKENEGKKMQRELLKRASAYFVTHEHDYEGIFAAFNRFRILSPLRKGELGVETLNRLFLDASLKDCSGDTFSAPILITRNDYKQELFNGEIGLLVCRRSEGRQELHAGDFALFPGKGSLPMRKIPALLLPRYEYAYCLSVHKSQGSEFDHVLLVLPRESQLSSRELLYTGVTRARKKIEIWGAESTIKHLSNQSSHRLSGLQFRIN